ncbi:hypothetical protein K8O68_05875 [Salipaludibacillus sp. CUR1]|uniref:hypothetical protein n=1 Tax=Salipaludibacillus sp. CUR1 TaxID=2820003 RepID=UPI001E38CD5D|nr:hypothetical protein [Salipaludibacillus sp. CUR1]MCE7791947.1 hypothetical protein [Salipaludibacillus sp. CUR1]
MVKDSLISINELYIGLMLKDDIFDRFDRLLLKKGTIITPEHLKNLTSLKQSYFLYRSTGEEGLLMVYPVISNLNAFLRTFTFVEEKGLSLNEIKRNYYPVKAHFSEEKWEYLVGLDYIKEVNYKYLEIFRRSHTDLYGEVPHHIFVRVCEQIAFWLNKTYWSGSIQPLAFYEMCLCWVKKHAGYLLPFLENLLVPLPEGATVLLEDGEEYEVMQTNAEEPFKPLLRKKYSDGTFYFVEDIFTEIHSVPPVSTFKHKSIRHSDRWES